MNIELMRELTQAIGISGQETQVSRILKGYYQQLADEVIYDNLGSIAAVKLCGLPNAKKVLVLAHMDEVGMMVKEIYDNGCVGFEAIGGLWEQNLLAQRVKMVTDQGILEGTIGSIAPHLLTDELRGKPMPMKHMYVDFGFVDKAQAQAAGVKVNNQMVLDGPFVVMNNQQRILSKAWDDRYGCIMGIELLQAMQGVTLPFDLYVGASVQEEVGIRGAKTLTHLVQPDLCIVLDCSPANDYSTDKDVFGILGKGPLVRFLDRNYLPNRALINHYEQLMIDHNIPYQYYVSMGGTDAGEVHKAFAGVPTLTMCICARNIHSNSSVIDLDDYRHAHETLKLLISGLTAQQIEEFAHANR